MAFGTFSVVGVVWQVVGVGRAQEMNFGWKLIFVDYKVGNILTTLTNLVDLVGMVGMVGHFSFSFLV